MSPPLNENVLNDPNKRQAHNIMKPAEAKEHNEIVANMPLVFLSKVLDVLDATRYSGTYFDAEANDLEIQAVHHCLLQFNN